MSYKLEKPYTRKERCDFIVKYNLQQGLIIEEGENALYALEAFEKLVDDEVVDNTEEYTAELEEKEQVRIANLSLTAADVERALYKAFGKDFDDIVELASSLDEIDIKALKIELKANNFYRGNEYISKVGALLGISQKQLDEFFESNDYTKLLSGEEND